MTEGKRNPLKQESKDVLKCAIVGFGRMGITHSAILRTHPRVSLVGVCEPSKQMAKNVRRFLDIKTYGDLDQMLEIAGPDFVIVSTPTGMHANQVSAALASGAHVFVEKPFVLSVDEGCPLIDRARNTRRVNQVGYVNRYNDVFRYIRNLLSDGTLANPDRIEVEIRSPTILKKPGKSWRGAVSKGGGCLFEMGSHGLDLMNYMIGDGAEVESAWLRKIYSIEGEDEVEAILAYPGGVAGRLYINWSDHEVRKPAYKLTIGGKDWNCISDQHEVRLEFLGEVAPIGFKLGKNIKYATELVTPVRFYLRGYEFTRQLDRFVDAMFGDDGANLCTFAQALEVNRMIEKIRDIAQWRRHA